jgi:hypothetical protein
MSARPAIPRIRTVEDACEVLHSVAADLVALANRTRSGRVTALAIMATHLRDQSEEIARPERSSCHCPFGRCTCDRDAGGAA